MNDFACKFVISIPATERSVTFDKELYRLLNLLLAHSVTRWHAAAVVATIDCEIRGKRDSLEGINRASTTDEPLRV